MRSVAFLDLIMPEDPPTHSEFIPGITSHHHSNTYLLQERGLLRQHTSISLQLQETGAASASPGQQPPQSAPAGLPAIHDPGGSQPDPGGDGQVAVAATSCALLHQFFPNPFIAHPGSYGIHIITENNFPAVLQMAFP